MSLALPDGTIWISDSSFQIPSPSMQVYPVVRDWGVLRAMLTNGGRPADGEAEIELSGIDVVVTQGGTTRVRLIDALREQKAYDVDATVYSWNEADTTQTERWRGSVLGISGERLDGAGTSVTLRVSQKTRSLDITTVGDVVQRDAPAIGGASYANAPTDSLGAMIPRGFGRFYSGLTAAHTSPNDAIFLGYGTGGVEGVVTAENITDAKADVHFMHSGAAGTVTAYDSVLSGTSNTPEAGSHFWIHFPDGNTYGLIDAADFTATNSTTEVKIQVKLEPRVFAALRPSGIGSVMDTGFNATAYKILDDDPTNFVESDGAGNDVWAFNIPPLGISNFQLIDVRAVVDIENASGGTRDIDFGIWDIQGSGGTPNSWLGGAGTKRQTQASISATRTRYYQTSGNAYTVGDFQHHGGSDTMAQARDGTFVSTDASENQVHLQVRCQVSSASKNGVRLYGIGLVVRGVVWMDRVRRVGTSPPPPKLVVDPLRGLVTVTGQEQPGELTRESSERSYKYIFTGFGHEDDGTTYEGGGAGDPIRRGTAALHYMISELVPTEGVFTTANSLGSFAEALDEVQAEEKRLNPVFGPEVFTVDQAVSEISRRTPIRTWKDRGTWRAIYDEMNPHSSRYYRSTADPVRIKATEHVVGPVRVLVDDGRELVNRVVFNYGNAFGSNRPSGSHSYSNPYSLERFGSKRPLIVDEPWIRHDALGTVPESAKYMAKYFGRVNARPRMTLVVPLSQAFYDLQRGHVLELDTDWESVGWECPAYRCGLLDTMWYRGDTTITVNYANSTAPIFITSGGVTSETYFIAQGMFDKIHLFYTNTATYTEVNNGWEYSSGVDSSDEPTWTALSGVTDSDGGDPDTCFQRTGPKTISFTRPGLHQWQKVERTFGSGKHGPGYAVRLKYANATDTAVGNARTRVPAQWYGRPFEVIEVTEKWTEGGYPYIDAVLRETF